MTLHVLGSSSKGNGYVLEINGAALVIECGFSLRTLRRKTKIKASQIVGVLCSHSHGDHAKYIQDYVDAGYKICTTDELISKHNIPKSQLIDKQIDKFLLKFFIVKHDVPCYGFLILHPDFGKILFATDMCALPPVAKDIKLALIEANYSEEILDRNERKGHIHSCHGNRVRKTHFELTNCISYIKQYRNLEMIILLHLSSQNADPEYFNRITREETGLPVVIASSGLTLEIGSNEHF